MNDLGENVKVSLQMCGFDGVGEGGPPRPSTIAPILKP